MKTILNNNRILIPAISRVESNIPLKKNWIDRKVRMDADVATETRGVAAALKNSIRILAFSSNSRSSFLRAIAS